MISDLRICTCRVMYYVTAKGTILAGQQPSPWSGSPLHVLVHDKPKRQVTVS